MSSVYQEYSGRKCNVYLLHGDMSEEEMTGLYNHPKIKALVNIAHGEGFGLPMFEAAREGLPVITIGWSGQLDFLNPAYTILIGGKLENVHPSAANQWLLQETQWFRISDKDSIRALKDVYTNYKKYSN